MPKSKQSDSAKVNFGQRSPHQSKAKAFTKKPGPRPTACPWCGSTTCTCCRCPGTGLCDHIAGEGCSRDRYNRRLVCNPCEKHKLRARKEVIGNTVQIKKAKIKKKSNPFKVIADAAALISRSLTHISSASSSDNSTSSNNNSRGGYYLTMSSPLLQPSTAIDDAVMLLQSLDTNGSNLNTSEYNSTQFSINGSRSMFHRGRSSTGSTISIGNSSSYRNRTHSNYSFSISPTSSIEDNMLELRDAEAVSALDMMSKHGEQSTGIVAGVASSTTRQIPALKALDLLVDCASMAMHD